jgi:hypothetical protein
MSAQYPEPRNVECIPGDPKPSGLLRGRHDRGRKRRIVRIQDVSLPQPVGGHCPFEIGQVRFLAAAGGLSAVTVSAQVRGGDREPPGEAGYDFVPYYLGLRISTEQHQR